MLSRQAAVVLSWAIRDRLATADGLNRGCATPEMTGGS
jgi:hypothetical protein